MTIFLTTHDMDEADALCSELAILHRGKVAVIGKPDELKASLGPDATLDTCLHITAAGPSRRAAVTWMFARRATTARRLG